VTAVCELGPGVLRLLHPRSAQTGCIPGELVDAVLQAGDDPLVLIGERAVSVSELWGRVFRNLLGGGRFAAAELIHPSWWPAGRAESVAGAARTVVETVTVRPRAELAAHGSVWIEIGPAHVAVVDAVGPVSLVSRCGAIDSVVEQVSKRVPAEAGSVIIDIPEGVAGAEDLGVLLAQRLGPQCVVVDRIDTLVEIAPEASVAVPGVPSGSTSRIRYRVVVATLGLAVLTVVPVLVAGRFPGAGGDVEIADATAELIEGKVATRIPADWLVQRVTDGPGSARIRVGSPVDPEAVLHITWSRVGGGDPADTAAVLGDLLAAQPPGVFVDFNPDDRRSGRPAVTYREVRAGHDIRWTVITDGEVRIGIGCQSAVGREESIAAVCEQAIGSARQIH
jgi:type VII secretion-associated protein (TIGR03931 family)